MFRAIVIAMMLSAGLMCGNAYAQVNPLLSTVENELEQQVQANAKDPDNDQKEAQIKNENSPFNLDLTRIIVVSLVLGYSYNVIQGFRNT